MLAAEACNPFGCYAKYRFSEFRGLLNSETAPPEARTVAEPGIVFVSLDQQSGNGAQEQVSIALNVWGFADSVAAVELRQKTGSKAGRLLFSTSSGYLVRDSVWNGYPVPYIGPLSWDEFWNTMNAGNAYVELHPGNGLPVVKGALGLVRSIGFQPACTD